jgi:hypothetical protein
MIWILAKALTILIAWAFFVVFLLPSGKILGSNLNYTMTDSILIWSNSLFTTI